MSDAIMMETLADSIRYPVARNELRGISIATIWTG